MFENFIYAYQIDNSTVIDGLVHHFDSSPKVQGALARSDGSTLVDKKVKDSINVDITVPTNVTEVMNYFSELKKAADYYNEIYSFSYMRWGISETLTIQKYAPHGGYHQWHAERVGPLFPNVTRYLVFMTYLNDVTDQGETEFFYQKVKFAPKKGLTLIWPAEWTHTHRGISSPSQEKIIITGWLNLI